MAAPSSKASNGNGQLPPGSLGLPWIGETVSFALDNHRFFETRFKKYGPVFKSRLFGRPVAFFIGHDAFTFFIDHPAMTRDGSNPAHLQRLLAGPSLPMLAGERHAAVKRQILDAFNDEAMARYIPVIENAIRRSLDRWETWDEEFSWIPEFQDTAYLISDALFTGSDPAKRDLQYRKTLDEFLAGFTAIPVNLPFTGFGRAMRGRDRLLSRIDAALARHHQAKTWRDVMGKLILAPPAGEKPLGDEQLRLEILHLYFAGYAGIYIAMALLAMDLALHPNVRIRARREVREVTPRGLVSIAQLNDLRYVGQVCREVLRTNRINASTFMARVAQPIAYNGYTIPADWRAFGGVFTTMQDGKVFKQPHRFDPERFGPARSEGDSTENAYVPQGGGASHGHRCAGEKLIETVMKVTAVYLLRKYTWELPEQDMSLTSDLFPLPRDLLRVRLSKLADL
jgi:cytochrome P450